MDIVKATANHSLVRTHRSAPHSSIVGWSPTYQENEGAILNEESNFLGTDWGDDL